MFQQQDTRQEQVTADFKREAETGSWIFNVGMVGDRGDGAQCEIMRPPGSCPGRRGAALQQPGVQGVLAGTAAASPASRLALGPLLPW